jgi:hypothetical protein
VWIDGSIGTCPVAIAHTVVAADTVSAGAFEAAGTIALLEVELALNEEPEGTYPGAFRTVLPAGLIFLLIEGVGIRLALCDVATGIRAPPTARDHRRGDATHQPLEDLAARSGGAERPS